MTKSILSAGSMLTRRTALKGMAAGATLLASPAVLRAASGGTIKLGAPFHRTGIGASYGRWYERVAQAAVKLINDGGGINGKPIEMIVEDDGTDPKRGTEYIDATAEARSDLRAIIALRGRGAERSAGCIEVSAADLELVVSWAELTQEHMDVGQLRALTAVRALIDKAELAALAAKEQG